MRRIIPLFLLLLAGAGFNMNNARAADVGVSLNFGNGGYYYPYNDDGYVTYYDDSGYYPYAYDSYGYYYPDYNWNTGVSWYGGWYGDRDHDRDYWRGNRNYYSSRNYNTNYYGGRSSSGYRSGTAVRSSGGASVRSSGGRAGGGHGRR